MGYRLVPTLSVTEFFFQGDLDVSFLIKIFAFLGNFFYVLLHTLLRPT